MDKLKLIIKREYNAKVRNKSFIVMTILAPFLMVGMGLLIFYLSKANDNDVKTIAYVDNANLLDNIIENGKGEILFSKEIENIYTYEEQMIYFYNLIKEKETKSFSSLRDSIKTLKICLK